MLPKKISQGYMKKIAPAKKSTSRRRKPAPKKSKTILTLKRVGYGLIVFVVLGLIAVGYHYRDGLAYYLSYKTDKVLQAEKEEKRISDVRIYEVLSKHDTKVIGFDVSQYQGKIKWDSVKSINQNFNLGFVFIRATAGKNAADTRFEENWKAAGKTNMVRGAYHYYRPNENSIEQAENFIRTVRLRKGDLPPVLDIEQLPKNQSLDSLKKGLGKWLKRVEKAYGTKPIIYSGESYYSDFLEEEFSEYTFWIANYNFFVERIKDEWLFWQFTEKASVNGIKGNVDVNIFNGTENQLQNITIE